MTVTLITLYYLIKLFALFEKGINLFEEDAEVGDRKFDVITLWHVLEHIEEPIEKRGIDR